MQRWEVDHSHLTDDGKKDGDEKESIGEQADFEDEFRLRGAFGMQCSIASDIYLRSAAESVEHVEEDETGECHGGVSWRDFSVAHLPMRNEGSNDSSSNSGTDLGVEHAQSSHDNHSGTDDDVDDELRVDHGVGDFSRWLFQDVAIDWLHTETEIEVSQICCRGTMQRTFEQGVHP